MSTEVSTEVKETVQIGNKVYNLDDVTPSAYFEYVKGQMDTITDVKLKGIYANTSTLLKKYMITGQTEAAKKLVNQLDILERELKLINLGINKVVFKQDIELYIDKISKDVVKIIDLAHYERDIPDEFIDLIANSKDLFDQMYVVFTDYTGKEEKKVEKARREKDPILFGCFLKDPQIKNDYCDRYYVICSWEDEFCDLTLDKFTEQYTSSQGLSPVFEIKSPETMEELKEVLGMSDKKPEKDSSLLKRIGTAIKQPAKRGRKKKV